MDIGIHLYVYQNDQKCKRIDLSTFPSIHPSACLTVYISVTIYRYISLIEELIVSFNFCIIITKWAIKNIRQCNIGDIETRPNVNSVLRCGNFSVKLPKISSYFS